VPLGPSLKLHWRGRPAAGRACGVGLNSHTDVPRVVKCTFLFETLPRMGKEKRGIDIRCRYALVCGGRCWMKREIPHEFAFGRGRTVEGAF